METKPYHSLMDLFKELYELIGSKIQFKTNDGEYEGNIKYVYPKSKRVTIEHVLSLPTRGYMGTQQHFFLREFLSYTVLEPDIYQKAEKWDYISRIVDGSYVAKKYKMSDVFYYLEDVESESEESIPDEDEFCGDDYVLNLPPNLKSKLPHDCVILEKFDAEFGQAINYISKQKTIGVSFEGPKISRLGKLTWVCISTPYCVFLFDIGLLGKDAFDKGLRGIFQDKRIEKVIHDCREPSDCLYHLFSTEMVNVFDTQVADFIINMQRYSDKTGFKYVSSLDCCLVNYLDVPQDFLYNREKNFSYQEELRFFTIRPISNDYRDAVIKNALYLTLLKESLAELLLNPFRKAVDVYLNVLSNATEPELLLDISVSEKLPPALVMQGIQTVRFQDDTGETTAVPLVCKFRGPDRSIMDDYHKPSNIQSKNTSLKSDTLESKIICDKNIQNKKIVKDKKIACKGIDSQRTLPDTKSVVIEKMRMQNSKKHIDNVYHHLVNNLNVSNSIIDVKPQDHVSNFLVKKSGFSGIEETLASQHNTRPQSSKSELNNSYESFYKCSSNSDVSIDTSAESIDRWARLRSDFDVSVNEKVEGVKKKLRLLPAGM